MQIKEFMSHPVTVVQENTTLEEIARTLLERNIGCVPVVDAQGKVSGIITESDFAAREKGIPFSTFRAPQLFGQWMNKGTVERMYETARKMTAKEIMRHPVVTLTENQGAEEAIELLLKHDINRVPVVRDGVPVGIVSRHDLLRLMAPKPA
ncbi:MAG: CBS domain-containing protein [Blastocatellia bacterium]|nr:CBS domain-containing protein [Blastocatellia bacterium]